MPCRTTQCYLPLCRADILGDRAFSVAAPRAWNRLPIQLKLLRSTTTFCHQLKTFLFQSTYGALPLLVGRQEGHPACKKNEWWGAGVVICLKQGADLHTAQLIPLSLTVSCFSKIQTGFTFLVPAHPGSLGKRAVKRVCVCVCVHKHWLQLTSMSQKPQ